MAQVTADMLVSIIKHADEGVTYPLTANELRQLAYMAMDRDSWRRVAERLEEEKQAALKGGEEGGEAPKLGPIDDKYLSPAMLLRKYGPQ